MAHLSLLRGFSEKSGGSVVVLVDFELGYCNPRASELYIFGTLTGVRFFSSDKSRPVLRIPHCSGIMLLPTPPTPFDKNLSAVVRPSVRADVRACVHVCVSVCICVCVRAGLRCGIFREKVTGKFVLRRTKEVIRGSLPPALEVVIFCRPSPQQLALYESYIASSAGARSLLYGSAEGRGEGGEGGAHQLDGQGESEEEESEDGEESEDDVREERKQQQQRPVSLQGVLPLISTLRRLCNHPDLVAGINDNVGSSSGSGSDNNVEDARDDALGTSQKGSGGDLGKENSIVSTVTASRSAFKRPWKIPRSSGGGAAPAAATAPAAPAAEAAPRYETEASGKLLVLEALLKAVRRECPGDKVRDWCVPLKYLATSYNAHPPPAVLFKGK